VVQALRDKCEVTLDRRAKEEAKAQIAAVKEEAKAQIAAEMRDT
jgi:hypothetical protein